MIVTIPKPRYFNPLLIKLLEQELEAGKVANHRRPRILDNPGVSEAKQERQ